MTKEELAAKLNGGEYPFHFTGEASEARRCGLVIVMGESDDIMAFNGVITDEVAGPGVAYVNATGLLPAHYDDCECKFCGYQTAIATARKIEALWCAEPNISWTFKTDIPHATFVIFEDEEPFCRGIVFSMGDLNA